MSDNHGLDEFGSPVHSRREPALAMSDLSRYRAKSGRLVPVWTLEIQTLPEHVIPIGKNCIRFRLQSITYKILYDVYCNKNDDYNDQFYIDYPANQSLQSFTKSI